MSRSKSTIQIQEIEKALKAAFETSDLRRICHALDKGVMYSGGVSEIAKAAHLDRVTLYRGLRLGKGLALGNMMKVLRALGFRLSVEMVRASTNGNLGDGDTKQSARLAASAARRFTAAFKAEDMDALLNVFRETLLAQENITQFASKTNRTREALYRVFIHNPMPRFSTLLSFLSALDLRFAVRRLTKAEVQQQTALRDSEGRNGL